MCSSTAAPMDARIEQSGDPGGELHNSLAPPRVAAAKITFRKRDKGARKCASAITCARLVFHRLAADHLWNLILITSIVDWSEPRRRISHNIIPAFGRHHSSTHGSFTCSSFARAACPEQRPAEKR